MKDEKLANELSKKLKKLSNQKLIMKALHVCLLQNGISTFDTHNYALCKELYERSKNS